jgi:phage tail-like protein
MSTGDRVDPVRGFNFKVELNGITSAHFRECSGLTFETASVEYREGHEKQLHVRKLHGLRKFNNIVLKRGITADKQLWDWYLLILNGTDARRDGSVTLTDEDQAPVHRWSFKQGWICKWEGPAMNATSNDVAIETIEICVERVEMVS